MTVSTKTYDMAGNQTVMDGATLAWDAMTNAVVAPSARPTITCGTGVPTFAAVQNSLYIRLDGGAGARLYANSTGSTTWIVVGSAA